MRFAVPPCLVLLPMSPWQKNPLDFRNGENRRAISCAGHEAPRGFRGELAGSPTACRLAPNGGSLKGGLADAFPACLLISALIIARGKTGVNGVRVKKTAGAGGPPVI